MIRKFIDKLERLLDGDDSAADGKIEVAGQDIPTIDMPELKEELLERHEFAPGYFRENMLVTAVDGNPGFKMEKVVTAVGVYVGDPDTADFLINQRGIRPELAPGRERVCSIGFCEAEQKWYGWSHRAICGFGVGDVAAEGDSCTTSGWTTDYLAAHPEDDLAVPVGFEAKTLDDAKRMAIAFAESVG